MDMVKKIGEGEKALLQHNIELSELLLFRCLLYRIFLNFIATGPFKADKLPFFLDFHDKRTPPSDVILFRSSICTNNPICISHSDVWDVSTSGTILNWPSGSESGLRFKLFLQLGHSSFILACTGGSDFEITYDKSLFTPLLGKVKLHEETYPLTIPPSGMPDNLTNRILWSIRLKAAK